MGGLSDGRYRRRPLGLPRLPHRLPPLPHALRKFGALQSDRGTVSTGPSASRKCAVEVTAPRAGLPIYWRDGESSFKDPTLPSAVFYETGGFYDGAVRIWGIDSDQARDVVDFGNAHAVSDGSTP